MNDFVNRFVNKSFYYSQKLKYNIQEIFCKLIARLKGVKLGDNIRMLGFVHFHRFPESSIQLGECCEFRSGTTSNLIGVNRKCIISTHTKNAKIIIGKNSGFSGVSIGCRTLISIGNNCMFGANVVITDTDWHSLNPEERRTGTPKSVPTIIGNNVFVGVNSIILKGSVIGDNSVIGAGSVVSGKIPTNVIAAGNPCKIIKALN